jgi:hypothetical protein
MVVSPHFPPIDAADMHRVRISLPHFRTFGWNPVVLAVAPEYVESVREPMLLNNLNQFPVSRVRALPSRVTRKFGLGNLGLRAFPFLYRTGCQLIPHHCVDVVYFSTTVFSSIPLGRIWRHRFGVPFVIDMQDPWLTDYYDQHPESAKPPKYWAAMQMHRRLEPWAMQAAGGLIAVSEDYITTLRKRYPCLESVPWTVLPFGATQSDFDTVRTNPQPNRFFRRRDGRIHGVYVGRGGSDMGSALRIIFGAFRRGLHERTALFSKIQLHFVGTDYAPANVARKTVEPIAQEFGVAANVNEHPARIPYFEGLQLLLDADFLIVPGSDDPQYTASKIYPYILAGKPLVSVFHQRSSVCNLVKATDAGIIVAFDPLERADVYSNHLIELWTAVLERIPFEPQLNRKAFAPYTEIETARQQCQMFSQVLAKRGDRNRV